MARTAIVCALVAAVAAAVAAGATVVTAPASVTAPTPGGESDRAGLFPLSIIHLNDFHARFEQTDPSSGTCHKEGDESECVGGIARVIFMAKKLLAERPNPLLLNAGDNFQGTLWFTLFKSNITAQFLNMLPWNAITLGNHEFDKGVQETVTFIDLLNSTMVVANLNTTKEPAMEGLCKNSTIEEVDGRKVGIIGVLTATTAYSSSPGNLSFLDEIETVKEEARRLYVDEKVNIIVVLSHAGIEMDQKIAKEDPNVDIIVGGHSHTFLYNPPDKTPGNQSAFATYPLIVTQESGRKVAIVQAYAYTKYLGNLTAFFDDNGELVSAEGNPVLLNKDVEMDAEAVKALEPWEALIGEKRDSVVGRTAVLLEQTGGECRVGECNLGSAIADSYALSYVGKGGQDTWTRAAIGITNAGGVRTAIKVGNITYGDMMTTQPFENTVDYIELQGEDLVAVLEQAVADTRHSWPREVTWGRAYFGMLQVSGLHLVYDPSRPSGSRLVDLQVLCHACQVPVYKPVDNETWYPIAINSFLAGGGDAFYIFRDKARNHKKGSYDYEAMQNFLNARNPVTQARDGRITFRESEGDNGGDNGGNTGCGDDGGASSLPRFGQVTLGLLVGGLLWWTRGM